MFHYQAWNNIKILRQSEFLRLGVPNKHFLVQDASKVLILSSGVGFAQSLSQTMELSNATTFYSEKDGLASCGFWQQLRYDLFNANWGLFSYLFGVLNFLFYKYLYHSQSEQLLHLGPYCFPLRSCHKPYECAWRNKKLCKTGAALCVCMMLLFGYAAKRGL